MGRITKFDPLAGAKLAKRTRGDAKWRELQATESDLHLPKEQWKSQSATLALTLAKWDITRGVYRFDETLRAAIAPADILKQSGGILNSLPEQCVYIELDDWRDLSGQPIYIHGAYLFVARQSENISRALLWILAQGEKDTEPTPLAVPLLLNASFSLEWALFDGVADKDKRARMHESESFISELLSLAAYLCSAEPDIRNPREPRNKPNRHIKNNGPVRHWEVGYRFGAAFRKQLAEAEKRAAAGYTGDERNRPRVHVRRAHWHSFWTGPMDGERKLITKWLPPTIVNAEGGELPVTVWKQS